MQAAQLPGMLRRYRPQIGDGLRSRLSRPEPAVYDMLRYYLGWVDQCGKRWDASEGKSLRPTLCLFACEATGGTSASAIPAAVALEFIHNFSLIHDDIQDRDETRHHRQTLWAVWGIPKALVAGNVLRVVADRCLVDLEEQGLDIDTVLGTVELLTEAYLEMIEGQYLDLAYEGRPDIGMDDYFEMISRKTGALIRCAMNLGAFIGSRDSATVGAFRTCGRSLGYVFQITDDALGVWGQEESTGKPVGADIRRKKNSFPVVYAMSRAEGVEKRALLDIYAKDCVSDADVSVVLDVMERTHAREQAMSLAEEHRDRALTALAEVEMSSGARRDLEELGAFLLVRQH